MSVRIGRQGIQSVKAGTAAPYVGAKAKARRLSMSWVVAPLVLLDMVCVVLSMWAAYQVRFRLLEYQAAFSPDFYVRMGAIAVVLWGVLFAFHRLYQAEYLFGGFREYGNVINACTLGVVGLILYTFLVRADEYDISRKWLVMVWLFSISSVEMGRFLYRRVVYHLRERGFFTRRVLIVGANEEGQQVAAQLHNSPRAGIEILGFVDPQVAPGTQASGFPVLGDLGSLGSLIGRLEAEELIVIPTALDREALLGLYRDWGKDGVRIRLSSGLYELFTTGVRVKEEGFVPLFTLNRTRITGVDAILKAVVDYAIASTAIVLLSPILLFIAILIKRNSCGPVIHRRRVVGLYGRVFDAFKFRTMVPNAEACLQASPELQKEWEETGKIQNDPRITGVGRVLRRFSLDELPQLFNVLRGEMSLVGPRMITPAELNHFGRWRYNLLTVKPGMTGLWQVSGRSDVSYEERVRLDMHYIRNHTMWLDLHLLVATVTAVLAGRGAY